ncbi:MAG: hypothetical protein QOH83_2594 [Solirubrobacteraceae bacterium]|jgi:hypothetical protein|nr:hypothetical protein [Solirubrobacteraceae bacterium]
MGLHGMDFLAIREQSVQRLGQWKLSDPGPLPLHREKDFDWMRSTPSVTDRCHAIAAALALAHRAPVQTVRAAVDDNDLEGSLGARERELLRVREGDVDAGEAELQQLLVDISWREEALHALLWALGLVDDLPPDQMCPKSPVYELLAPGLDPGNARQDVQLRPLAQIAAMLDFYYCLHWHARKAQYHGDVWDYQIAPGVVLERRRALEWLFQDAEWEDVDLAV